MLKLDRAQSIAATALFLVVLTCIAVPIVSLGARSQAAMALKNERDELHRLQVAHRRLAAKESAADRIRPAPSSAFLNAQTPGLASAQLEAYVSRVASAQQAILISSGVQQARQGDAADVVRIQASLTVNYAALQNVLFALETGTPYVFVDSMILEPAGRVQEGQMPDMRVTLNLRAIWRRTQM